MIIKVLQKNAKRIIKRGFQEVAANFGRHTRSFKDPQLLILMYHRILPYNDPRSIGEEPGMIVTPKTFRLHLKTIKEYFKVIHLSDWIESKKMACDFHGRYCAITFDDGWADNYQFAYPILMELGIPATIFVVSEMVGSQQMFWPERLSQLVNTIADEHPDLWSDHELSWIRELPVSYCFSNEKPTNEQISEIIANTKFLSDEEIHKRLDHIEKSLNIDIDAQSPLVLNWQQISDMTSTGHIQIGSHTCTHTRLNHKLPDTVLSHEIAMSKKQIENHINQPVRLFCYPNGDYTSSALDHVRLYYECAVTTQSGWNSKKTDTHQLRRIGLHEDISNNKTAFLARISGWI